MFRRDLACALSAHQVFSWRILSLATNCLHIFSQVSSLLHSNAFPFRPSFRFSYCHQQAPTSSSFVAILCTRLLLLQALACDFAYIKHKLGSRASEFVMPADGSSPALATSIDLTSAPGQRSVAPPTLSCLQPTLCRVLSVAGTNSPSWNEHPRPPKLFSEDSTSRPKVVAGLLVAM